MQADSKKKYGTFGKRMINPKDLIELFRGEKEEKRDKAAHIIQKTWKRWLDMGVFEYYKELIGFKQYGEPSHLMKYIEPREAEFLDAAAGVHIKFRLGGYWKGVDSLTTKDNTKIQEFHHSPRQRKRNMEKRRKTRKIEWLKKMYFGENLQVKTENPEAIALIQRATEGLIKSLEKEGIDQVMEWEVDEMLKWTNALNYDEYVKLWKEVGTSKTSESFQAFQFTQQYYVSELIPKNIQELMQSQYRLKERPIINSL
ncbi:uncharacterized protein C11orf65 homolog [Notechis scutatus]|uniref:Uncharacterized protein C11orf65 homolog n=1 Tax=Notechis scutatus TaxID=8663 RepID=A0A6J1VD63_9SAUR|nr:uncharacterized protein C11orf65 homolog [Notechis scutatus]